MAIGCNLASFVKSRSSLGLGSDGARPRPQPPRCSQILWAKRLGAKSSSFTCKETLGVSHGMETQSGSGHYRNPDSNGLKVLSSVDTERLSQTLGGSEGCGHSHTGVQALGGDPPAWKVGSVSCNNQQTNLNFLFF